MPENRENLTAFGGADDSTNYLVYPTLMALPWQQEAAQQTVAKLRRNCSSWRRRPSGCR